MVFCYLPGDDGLEPDVFLVSEYETIQLGVSFAMLLEVYVRSPPVFQLSIGLSDVYKRGIVIDSIDSGIIYACNASFSHKKSFLL